jgi:hypothetical protein
LVQKRCNPPIQSLNMTTWLSISVMDKVTFTRHEFLDPSNQHRHAKQSFVL